MAKADQQSTSITWTWVRDIYPIVLEICGSPQCGPWLAEQIANSRVRSRAKATRPPDEPLDNFWQGSPPSIDFEQCTATKLVPAPPGTAAGLASIILLGLAVAREDIEALGPPKQARNQAGRFPKGTYISPNRRVWFADQITAWQSALDEHNPHYSPDRGRGRRRDSRLPMVKRLNMTDASPTSPDTS